MILFLSVLMKAKKLVLIKQICIWVCTSRTYANLFVCTWFIIHYLLSEFPHTSTYAYIHEKLNRMTFKLL